MYKYFLTFPFFPREIIIIITTTESASTTEVSITGGICSGNRGVLNYFNAFKREKQQHNTVKIKTTEPQQMHINYNVS